jgi:hypothetical protein
MTPEQQRIAIAEACGWTATVDDDQFWRATRADGSMTSDLWCSMSSVWNVGIPDYLNDLNAMHDAVSIFDYDQADEFEDHLCDICKRLNDEKENPAPWRFAVVNATASQRAEAFLRTIGKWKECK